MAFEVCAADEHLPVRLGTRTRAEIALRLKSQMVGCRFVHTVAHGFWLCNMSAKKKRRMLRLILETCRSRHASSGKALATSILSVLDDQISL
mmetsp:Transcript_69065/g.150262  ORF Transcript_69065/g.150262 Transcript_69065/m.150262 type:complete len:92 (-) Transcript_69065:27-302(-)